MKSKEGVMNETDKKEAEAEAEEDMTKSKGASQAKLKLHTSVWMSVEWRSVGAKEERMEGIL